MYLERIKNPEELKKLSVAELRLYASEVRDFIIETVTKNGGHLASNLGAVELSIALHYVFNSPKDKIVWDVGHQSYTHKLITGRLEMLKNLRQNGGASGFPSIFESEHDCFTSGHSSNSLSLASGLAKARDNTNQDFKVVSVIGDGAFSGGMVYEALNDIGENQSKMVIILNDNKMSISKNVGAMSKYFAKLRLSLKYNRTKQNIKKTLSAFPLIDISDENDENFKLIGKAKRMMKNLVVQNKLFENFGITYYGPFDGHNIGEMIEVFNKVLLKDRPVIIHLITQKGKGYEKAEFAPDKFHGLSKNCDFEQKDEQNLPNFSEKSFSDVFGETLSSLAKNDKRVVAITAAMCSGTGLDGFCKKFPSQYFDVSIAEQHAVSLCAGLAVGGMKPYFAVYSTFLQRAFDQVLHDVCINNLPVTFVIDRSGVVGNDGITHQGIFDLSYLSLIPNLTIVAPKDGNELKNFLHFSKDFNSPLAIRYPKSYVREYNSSIESAKIEFGKWEWIKCGELPVYLLAVGNRMLDLACDVAQDLDVNVINSRFVKPLDTQLIDDINIKGNLIITLEDNVEFGGFGSMVLSYCNNKNEAKIINLSHQDSFLDNREVVQSLNNSGLSKENIEKQIKRFL